MEFIFKVCAAFIHIGLSHQRIAFHCNRLYKIIHKMGFNIIRIIGRRIVGDFRLSDYQWLMNHYDFDRYVGRADDPQTAIARAKGLWLEVYGEADEEIEVSYDASNECWFVYGTLPPDMLGGVPYALIKRDGQLLGVMHSK